MLDVEWAENVELDVMLQWLEHTPGPLAQTQTGGWRLAAAGAMGNIIYPARAPHTQSASGAWKECRLRGDEDPSSWQGYNHPGGLCFIIHACIILLCCYVVSGNLAFCRHYNPTITRSRPVANRASNEDLRRFHNTQRFVHSIRALGGNRTLPSKTGEQVAFRIYTNQTNFVYYLPIIF